MKDKKLFSLAWALAFLATFQMNCATIVLTQAGKWSDKSKKEREVYSVEDAKNIAPGKRIIIQLKNGAVLTGRYYGLAPICEKLGDNDRALRDSGVNRMDIPSMADKVTVADDTGLKFSCKFISADSQYLYVIHEGGKWISTMSLANVNQIYGNHRDSLSAEELREIAASECVFDRAIIFESEGRVESVVADSAQTIIGTETKNAASTGLLLGLAIDFTFQVWFWWFAIPEAIESMD
ncbi:MAG: hypothetical protein CO189_04915 [candidate division Zixibacteria bacterium CG_4_9_14_3_um_filter_46_8]|nr:MAG: hypothetical protein CO189_04915 [candidate division Zixibacteria bacterium CG_4_9_14_3_um_filter_46_8]